MSAAATTIQAEELAGLDNVLTRLALTDEEKLEGVLHRLLPLVIKKLDGAAPAVQKKVGDSLGDDVCWLAPHTQSPPQLLWDKNSGVK